MPERFGETDKASGTTAADVDQRPLGEDLSLNTQTDTFARNWIDTTLSDLQQPAKPKLQPKLQTHPQGSTRISILDDFKIAYILWLPWALGLGIILYLEVLLPAQTALLVWTVPTFIAGCLLCVVVPTGRRKMLTLLLGIVAGLIAAEYRVTNLPTLPQKAPYGTISAEVLVLQQQSKEGRVRIDVQTLEPIKFPDGRSFQKFRLWGRGHEDYRVGAIVNLKFKLRPVPRPTHLQGYNPRWHAFFNQTAASGLIYGYPKISLLSKPQVSGLKSGVRWFFARLRDRVVLRLENVLDPSSAGIAQALLTGQRSQVSEKQTEDLRKSGLSHLLAISGLHISLVFGFCFLVMRCFTPLIGLFAPRFAALGHARDLALGVALAVALAYMLLAGSPLPTIRALTMTGLFAVAIFLRRQPFSLNAIALAACIILLMWPESLFGPSFLLSFCVVLALVAAARASQARNFKNRPKYAKRSWISRGTAPLRTYFFGVLVTSLIATFVSMPISMYFFQDHSLVGIFANLAAVPLAAFWVMPMAVISLFLMPFGLDEPSLQLMGWGIEILVRLADTTAGWDTMNLWVPPMPPTVLAAYVFALCILCFHRSRLRLAAPLIWFVVAGIGYQSQAPHLLISPQPLVAGMTGPTGIRPVTTRGRQAFTIDRWTQAFVPTKGALFNQHEQNHTTNCDFEGCIWTLSAKSGANIRVAVTNSEAATARDCQSVDMLFTSTRLTEKLKAIYGCKAELIALDNKQLKAEAPVSLWISQPNDLFNQSPIVMKTYAERMKHRPWY